MMADISDTASMMVSSDDIPVSFQECKNRANKAANLLFSNVPNPIDDGDVYYRLVQTSRVTGFLQCSRHPNGSSYIVGTSDYWLTNGNEAQSLRNRMARIMQGNLQGTNNPNQLGQLSFYREWRVPIPNRFTCPNSSC
ncbi:hypothetical protein IQ247_06945 [Plectonema cf. radiosum LEGE 06105]|uniref:Uncharacterized protein n=1 Tax=Plectonema cf. radiosum LEGE 06105 TaxID=945769 RepID=A0A8J7F3C7_9CYAN|nr:hypothetical protein [Plectonema cf. radiosum LEGE 06105]